MIWKIDGRKGPSGQERPAGQSIAQADPQLVGGEADFLDLSGARPCRRRAGHGPAAG